MLFGCTEDIVCRSSACHQGEYEEAPYVRTLCPECSVPVCKSCDDKLRKHDCDSKFQDGGTIPMSISNDHYYGHVNRYIVENNVTWLECAAACMIWSTMLVYYLESPYGHLMNEEMGNPQGRTHVKGNLFSFSMPWEDIERCCHQAVLHANAVDQNTLKRLQSELGVPHSEETLALLVNVHIVGGNKDLAIHLKGLTMRVKVLQELIEILRRSGYPGYEQHGVNAPGRVAQRLDERYTQKYGTAVFTPVAVNEAIKVLERQKTSVVQDKVATPSDAMQPIQKWDAVLRPHHIVAERSVRSQSNIHENYIAVFAKYGDVNIQTGNGMTDQHVPWYLGMAYPFTLPSAVGGYDVPQKPRWRRPEDEDLPEERAVMQGFLQPYQVLASRSAESSFTRSKSTLKDHLSVGPACKVKLFDLTRGLPQRIEGQYRRHWGFTPALWNLYFRECINLGVGLGVKRASEAASAGIELETDAAMAAADLVEKLEKGYYIDKGKRRKINGDFSKLIFAEKINPLQKRLLADFRFRCKAVPGTQEIRTKIGHLGFWAGVVYGNGIFMTISPGERHNYLAIRLSRYRKDDPFAAKSSTWIGMDKPSLQAHADDEFEVHIPGYDLRRVMLAEDPLAAANAFFVQIRTILATVLGLRMCPHCPHCAETAYSCQDAFGSIGELMGGLAGRADGMFGAVECQKSTGSLHYHFSCSCNDFISMHL